MRRTRIIATLGPASSSRSVIDEMISAGVDVFRLNFSHGTREGHASVIEVVRQAAQQAGRIVAVLQDLSGPKIRTGTLRGGAPVPLEAGAELRIVVGDAPGDAACVSTTYADLPKSVHPGDTMLLDDGRIELRVTGVAGEEIRTAVVDGGTLGERKGINVPGVELPTRGLTEKDIEDLRFGVRAGVDLVALSFVQSAAVLRQAREEARLAGGPEIPIVAKLERPEAITRLEEILRDSDAVMVARGDLGLELPLERVPRIQKEIVRRARALGVPVIVATQVLESMRTEPRPTRAEVSDAAVAVDEGVDAIMLAGETAAGAYPVRAVQMLDLVIREAESIPPGRAEPAPAPSEQAQAVCEAAVTLAERGDARAIVAVTRSGTTARMLAALRPRVPIVAVTDRADVSRRLALVWGVQPLLTDFSGDVGSAAARITADLISRGVLEPGSIVAVVNVTTELSPGSASFLRLQKV
jgi:pyruvate kinase